VVWGIDACCCGAGAGALSVKLPISVEHPAKMESEAIAANVINLRKSNSLYSPTPSIFHSNGPASYFRLPHDCGQGKATNSIIRDPQPWLEAFS
jgi:hypothetical protein